MNYVRLFSGCQVGGAKPLHVALAMSKLDRQRKARLCSTEGRRCSVELPGDEPVSSLIALSHHCTLSSLHSLTIASSYCCVCCALVADIKKQNVHWAA